jgi:hypothetical protein
MTQPIEQTIDTFDADSCLRAGAADRRSNGFRTAVHCLYRNRRKGPRREQDSDTPMYVDVHEPWLVYIAFGALLLSTCDAFFTLALLQHGSYEMNPFMDYFIQKDAQLFFIVKFMITSTCVVFLVMHKNFRLLNAISGYHLLYMAFSVYAMLVAYELSMLINLGFFSSLLQAGW